MTIAIVLIAIAVLAALSIVGFRRLQRRRAVQAERRARLASEARGHRQELEANSLRATEAAQSAEDRDGSAERHREHAEQLRREADRHERIAAEDTEQAAADRTLSDRARAAAVRHDERAQEVEEQLR